jgi:hypothetical protein
VQEGETEPLVELLAADVAFYGDGGGKAPAIGKPVFGRDKVAALMLGFARVALRQGARVEPIEVNGQPGALALNADGSLISVMALDISGGVITAIRSVPNPDKLAHISSTILPSLPPDLKRS